MVTLPLFQLLRLVSYSFLLQDYMCKTPSWAVFGAVQRGFDPVERRWHRKTLQKKDISGC
jgi:tRNA wybutosine-synthesizing protein 1